MASSYASSSRVSINKFTDEPVIKFFSPEGVSEESVSALTQVMQNLFSSCTIQYLDEKKFHFQELRERKILVVFPGASNLKNWKLRIKQQEEIKSLCVEGKIKILGICAGAYYLSQNIEFDGVDTDRGRDYPRALQLFSGKCQGPVVQDSEFSFRLGFGVPCTIGDMTLIGDGWVSEGKVTLQGGGEFIPSEEAEENRDYQVLATYGRPEDRRIAAVACAPYEGSFNAALMGPHPEYQAEHPGFESLHAMFQYNRKARESIEMLQGSLSKDFLSESMQHVLSQLGFK